MKFNLSKIANFKILITLIFLFLFTLKIYLNNFLMAENGDTYDFFRISYELSNGNFLYESKRLPLYSLLLVPFDYTDFVFYGRIINNLIYFLSVVFFYKLISLKFKLAMYEKILFTSIFAFNFVIFDNSFFILSDSLLLLFAVIFFYGYEKNYSSYFLAFIASLAFYTRFEGVLLIVGLLVLIFFQKKYLEIFKISIFFILLSLPLFLRIYLTSLTEASYLSDQAGFILSSKNVLKAFGSLFFATGGFWLLSVYLIDKANQDFIKAPRLLVKYISSNLYEILFILFSLLLILWGFYIRLYSVPIMLSILYFIKFIKSDYQFKKIWLVLMSILFFIYNVQFLDHFDLGFYKYSKIVSILLSLLIVGILIYKKIDKKFKIIAVSILIIIINLFIFFEKFFATNYKYYTLVQASEYALQNDLKNVAYFDESGVQKWYFKDFDERYKYFVNNESLSNWLKINNIEYIMITEEMGYQIDSINKIKKNIKNLEIVNNFESSYIGGKTTIYKLKDHEIPK
jgi:hypothetical protein